MMTMDDDDVDDDIIIVNSDEEWSGDHSFVEITSETRFSPIVNISITGRYLIPT